MKQYNSISNSIASYIAILLYISTGIAVLVNHTSVISIIATLLIFCGALGAYYKKKPLLDLWLALMAIASLISLIAIAPLDPDFTFDEIDNYNKNIIIRIIITIFLYGLFLTYFYFLNKMKPFPKKQIVGILILFSFITILIIYFRFFY